MRVCVCMYMCACPDINGPNLSYLGFLDGREDPTGRYRSCISDGSITMELHSKIHQDDEHQLLLMNFCTVIV